MTRSRMINTLLALMAALTIGTFVLILMEEPPILPKVKSLIAIGSRDSKAPQAVDDTDVPLQWARWRNIVVHTSGRERQGIDELCHFVIHSQPDDNGLMTRATDLWKKQDFAAHVVGPNAGFNDSSIAVCLVGDFASRRPGSDQFDELVSLVRALQDRGKITPGRVYLYRNLDPSSDSPGDGFPAERFEARLLTLR